MTKQAVPERAVAPGTLPRRLWLVTFLVGAVLWAAVAVAIALTDNTVLVPNLILLGTFLVPV
jgi:fatty acid desaturase